MLDIGWWELAVIGIVALIVVGPGELPALLRTIGRYVGMAKRQADEFRAQFDEAIRDSEFNDLRKEMNEIKSGVTSTFDDAQASLNKDEKDDKTSKDEYDWDKDGPIKPAPEFANDEPSTSFTMPDGEVVTKTGSTTGTTTVTATVTTTGTTTGDTTGTSDGQPSSSDAASTTPSTADAPSSGSARADAETVR